MKRKLFQNDIDQNKITKLKNYTFKSIILSEEENIEILYKDYKFSYKEGEIYSPCINDDALFSSKLIKIPYYEEDIIAHTLKGVDEINKVEKVIVNIFYPRKKVKLYTDEKHLIRVLNDDITPTIKKLLQNEEIEIHKSAFFNSFKDDLRIFMHLTLKKPIEFSKIKNIYENYESNLIEIEEIKEDKYCEYAFSMCIRFKNIYLLRKEYFENALTLIDKLENV